jgi:hypothetical protein
VAAKSDHNVAGFRNLQKLLYYRNGQKCNQLGSFVTLLKAVTMKMVIESLKNPSLAGFFVTVCDLFYFYTSLAFLYFTRLL